MTDLSVGFGVIVTGGDVRNAVQQTIKQWSVTYLAEVARLDPDTQGTLPDFRSYPDSLDLTKYNEEQVPACIMVVPGITKPPEKRGSGKIWSQWGVGLGIVVSGPTKERSIRLAEMYTAAVRAILLQQAGLKGSGATPFSSGVTWLAERYTDPVRPGDATRTLCAGMLQFAVDVSETVDVSQGPLQPITDGSAPTGWPTVATPTIALTGYPVDEEIPA